eukprot:270137-Amphidinium_carterae.1
MGITRRQDIDWIPTNQHNSGRCEKQHCLCVATLRLFKQTLFAIEAALKMKSDAPNASLIALIRKLPAVVIETPTHNPACSKWLLPEASRGLNLPSNPQPHV